MLVSVGILDAEMASAKSLFGRIRLWAIRQTRIAFQGSSFSFIHFISNRLAILSALPSLPFPQKGEKVTVIRRENWPTTQSNTF